MFKAGRCLLKKRLQERGLTQTELADRLDLSPQQISEYATGKRKMSLDTAKSISVILDCNIEDLYEWVHIKRRS